MRIDRASLSSQDGRTSCQLLAQNIINTQAQITSTVRRLRFSTHQRNPSVQCRHCAARRLATLMPAQGCRSFKCPVDSIDDERQDLGGYRATADTERGGNFTIHTGSRSATSQSLCPAKHYCSRSLINNEESCGATSTATRPRGHGAKSNSDDTKPPAQKPNSPTSSQPTKPRTRSELDLSIPRSSPVPLRTGFPALDVRPAPARQRPDPRL